ncbi:DUF1616 domain-containing protein [Salinarchaeum laminariae]|uniref:DUF1616 domain-containing protein n=1 Tax=Salinarchaeum laminariae TaxID=869888 RepID=UPI0020BF0B85|nr:DUF1616 domain-containing protein [Salinarchaeum laminariae]
MQPPLRALLPRPVRRLPADLAATIVLTGLTLLVTLAPWLRETPLRVALGLPFVLFLPGYAFIAALFPETGAPPTASNEEADDGTPTADESATPTTGDDGGSADGMADTVRERITRPPAVTGRGIDGIERVALSFGLSIAIVPLLGLVLNFTPWGIRLLPILVAVGGFTILAAIVAARRRWLLPPEDRFRVPYREWWAAGRAELFDPDDRTDAVLNVVLVLAVLLAAGSVGYAVLVPAEGEAFTEFYLLTETDDGDLVADGYPEELVVGEPANMTVGIGNEEHSRESYTVVVQLQRVEVVNGSAGEGVQNGTNVTEVEVVERQELDRMNADLADGETWQQPHEIVALGMTGEDRRLKYLLYRGEPPETVTAETAYRDLHLWVDVVESSGE